MTFETETFGKCEVICHFKDVAIVELENNSEKYVVTVGLSLENKNWENGFYCKDLKLAGDVFHNIVNDFYMIIFEI